jgi:hypothetical protein
MYQSRCSACNAPIFFAPSEKSGKPMPLDAEPELRVVLVNHLGMPVSARTANARAQVVETYLSHFATCPSANRFRKKAAEKIASRN